MKTGLKITLWVSGILFIGISTVFAIKSIKKVSDKKSESKEAEDVLKDTVSSNETTTQTLMPSDKLPFVLDKGNNMGGSQGLYVGQLQAMINYLYGNVLTIDGKYGQKTKDVLNKYLPSEIYVCNSATEILNKQSCQVRQSVWDYLLKQVSKKAPIANFSNYMMNNSEFKALGKIYKK